MLGEKSYALLDTNVYTFVVHPDASKPEIHDAIESIFGVKVLKVNTLNRNGKRKRNRRTGSFGTQTGQKRAFVTLHATDRDERFEGYGSLELSTPKPQSPGSRYQTWSKCAEITKDAPERSMVVAKNRAGCRNSYGRKTARHKGGGHKQRYRLIDFRRVKDGVPASVAAIEYDPNRTCRIALLHYHDGAKSYILAPKGVQVGDILQSGQGSDIRPGNALLFRYIRVGTVVHNVEIKPGGCGKIVSSAGLSM